MTFGSARSSAGDAPLSQRHQRRPPLMNSSAPTIGRMNLFASGSALSSSSFSSSERMRYPPSFGILPKAISGTGEMGVERDDTTTSLPATRYGLMFLTAET